jgi:hypothetical protein
MLGYLTLFSLYLLYAEVEVTTGVNLQQTVAILAVPSNEFYKQITNLAAQNITLKNNIF